ncbi:restriction endonuclease subunit S [Campylobacter sp. CN_NE4]|uniref:restriction endonuclease subunit S n=1 Tax=unclassified Campylobacter TaxID=2593542 RepID=UPI0022E9A2B3|nr:MULTISPECIES: restriction endonuclease subunit S [unclassified Campylobacter]MDA3065410.1 restriction endonuclease subunit S [Campylobacter sp. CN_NE4]MDA3069288.1 restriction endonuclease subunit S [Campylobacter sp. CN_NE3]MDA3084557.1 restriction endonuclease subunit S [Campylobacter sp. CN_NE1]WBR52920.1 restriction endonuclease subunit S [Campylobacter sp. CN_NE2]
MALNLNQTLQNKYPNLEISVLKYSDAMKDNECKRIDAEYFKKSALMLLNKICNMPHIILGEDYNISKLAGFEFTKYFLEENMNSSENYIALTSKNIQNERLDISDYITIDKNVADKNLIRSKILKHDVVLSYTGEYRRSLVMQTKQEFQLGPNICRIRQIKNNVSPFVVSTFFNSKIGQIILDKEKTLSAQPTVAMSRLRKLPIPLFPLEFQQQIEQMVRQSHECLEQSKDLYREAEVLLYQELGLNPQNPLATITPVSQSLNFSVRTLKESLHTTGRLDSEYYQIKYDEIEKVIKNYSGGYLKLKDIGEFKNGSLISEDFYVEKAQRAYIRIKELSFNEPIKIAESVFIDDNFEAKNETTVKENDFVIATIGNTIGKVNLIPKELNGSFISNNTSKFSLFDNYILPEFLELLLRSIFVQEQISREFTQTAQPKISNYSLENIIIPKINLQIQTQIAEKIKQSFALRVRANELLQSAKTKVETAIKQA